MLHLLCCGGRLLPEKLEKYEDESRNCKENPKRDVIFDQLSE